MKKYEDYLLTESRILRYKKKFLCLKVTLGIGILVMSGLYGTDKR